MDMYRDTFHRQVYNLLNLLSDIGGAQGALFIIGSYFVSQIAKRLLYSAMMEQVYQTGNGSNKQDIYNYKIMKKKTAKLQGELETDGIVDEEKGNNIYNSSLQNLMGLLISRKQFAYSLRDMMKEIFCCASCRKFKDNVKRQQFRQQYLYRKASKKLEEEFDALSLMKAMQ